MINRKIEDITESDLQALIDNKVIEGKTIEYKREMPNSSDTSKKEFLADISSFANSSGGDLIFGIEQDNKAGAPKLLNGIGIDNIDKEKTRLDNIIRDGVEPRILGINIKPILLSNSKYAIAVRISKSWNGPHRVIYGGHAKFYARNSSGKYEMDVDELRVSFNLTETLTERIRNFRADRIAKIMADETPVPLFLEPKIVLHLIPVNAFNPEQKYDLNSIYDNRYDKLSLIYRSVSNGRFNLDGLITYADCEQGLYSSYTQLYRQGILEAVDAQIISINKDNQKILPYWYEVHLIDFLNKYLKLFSELTVVPPIFIFLSLIGVKGCKIGRKNESPFAFRTGQQNLIDRDLLLLPETIIEDYNPDAKNILRPIFDFVWNACGFARSFNFDENGIFIAK